MTYDPYTTAFPAPSFSLRSDDFTDSGALPLACYNTDEGANESPSLRWSDLPAGTRSLVVTAFDADAPIPGGLWHWAVTDIPSESPGLDRNAGADGGQRLPHEATTLANDLGVAAYSGVQPPPGTGTHRLFICVTALSVPTLTLPPHCSLAMLNIVMIAHTLGRAITTATSQAPPAPAV